MEWPTYLEHIRSDAARLSEVALLGLDADVPCCAGWTVRDLVGHLGEVYEDRAAMVEEGRTERSTARPVAPSVNLLEWFDSVATRLVTVLSEHDPSEPVWTFYPPDQTVGFWYRRMAHESLIHRIDAEQAHGLSSEIDEALAADGVDEILTVMMSGGPPWGTFSFDDRSARLEIPARSWTFRLGTVSGTSPSTGTVYTDSPALELVGAGEPFRTVVAGSAAAMDLWLWGRGRLRHLIVEGDRSIAKAIRAVAATAT
jgi:uncharacterized protein (TIGR03083 family)